MWKLLLVPLFLYLAILVLLFAFQTRLLFPAAMVGGAGPLPPGGERLTLRAPDGETLHGVLLPASAPSPGAPLILGFGGNAWNAEAAAAYLAELYPGSDVLAFHYRGYAPSSGRPSAAALIADSLLVHDEAARRFPGRPIVAIGFSIGSGPAAFLASRRPVAGAILVTPFDSLASVAAGHYRWLPVRLLFRHPMPAAEWLREARVPIALIAAERDTLIPPERTAPLRSAIPDLVYDRTIPGARHNDLYDRPEFRAAMLEAVERVGSR
jgi:hypothetical protein